MDGTQGPERHLPARRRAGGARPRGAGAPCHGFTLLEVMIALGLLAFGILGVTAGQLASMKMSTKSRGDTLALYLAEQQMETFQAMRSSDVLALLSAPGHPYDPSNPIDPDPGDADPTSYDRSWQIQADTPELGVIALTVQVAWIDQNGATRTQTLHGFKVDL